MTRTRLILLATLGSVVLLGGAYVFQALGYAPCKLCLWQRWPHAAAIAIGALALGLRWHPLAWAGALAAATTSAIGFYHTGVERLWWPGPDTCTSGGDFLSGSPADLLARINEAPLIRCDEVAWELMWLSMASWNALASLALVAIWAMAARARA